MNDDEKELLKVGAETAMKPFADLITKLFGGPVEQFGGTWEDHLLIRRQLRRIKLLGKLQAAITEAGFEPQPISDNIWIPAVQEASLQDDETIQEKWANLLANAADPRKKNPVLPSFATMLKELTHTEAKFLDGLYEESSKPTFYMNGIEPTFSDDELKAAYAHAGLTRVPHIAPLNVGAVRDGGEDLQADLRDFATTLAITLRLGIFRLRVETEPLDVSPLGHGKNAPRRLNVGTSTEYIFTELARRFVRACRPPKKS